MHETKTKTVKKILRVAAGILMGCCALSAMAFAPDNEEPTPIPIETKCCITQTPTTMLLPTIEIPAPIVEESAEPSKPEVALNPYAELVLTDTEKTLLACMAFSESGNQPFDGQVAVVQVALNRYMHEAFSGSISDILFAPNQFAVGSHYEPTQMEAVETALAGDPVLDLNTDVVFFSTGSLTYGSYYKTIGDHVFRTYI